MKTNSICIYHAGCLDGFASAFAIYRFLDGQVLLYPGFYGDPPPDVMKRKVYLVDFSYKRDVMIDLAAQASKIIVLDHHKTAADELVNLPNNVDVHLDMEMSGAMLAWEYCFPGVAPPPIYHHIQDRDLWRYDLEYTNEICMALYSYPMKIDIWEKLIERNLKDFVDEGTTLVRQHEKYCQSVMKHVQMQSIAGFDVPVVNANYFLTSYVANELCKGHPFAACYWDGGNKRYYGLRSDDHGEDVSKIAQQFGGGGHQHAAGFKVPMPVHSLTAGS